MNLACSHFWVTSVLSVRITKKCEHGPSLALKMYITQICWILKAWTQNHTKEQFYQNPSSNIRWKKSFFKTQIEYWSGVGARPEPHVVAVCMRARTGAALSLVAASPPPLPPRRAKRWLTRRRVCEEMRFLLIFLYDVIGWFCIYYCSCCKWTNRIVLFKTVCKDSISLLVTGLHLKYLYGKLNLNAISIDFISSIY